MLTIIAGKPGQGKSYHMSLLLVEMLTEWVRSELKKGEPFDSSIWINIRMMEEGLNETVSKRIGQEVDVWKYINFCDDQFFNDSECTYWWTKFPEKSVIVIDEVHKYLGKKIEFGSLDMEQELINWISTHRHHQQEIYFLSQHTDQFARQVLGVADKLLEVVNIKSLDLSWPISIPMQDIYDLKSAFGIKTQYYQANVGNFRGKAIRWGDSSHRHMMSEDIFRVYKSHATDGAESDRPELDRTAFEAVQWFLRKHGWHLIPKAVIIFSLPFIVGAIVFFLPQFLMAAVSSGTALQPEVAIVSPVGESLPAVPPALNSSVASPSFPVGGTPPPRPPAPPSGIPSAPFRGDNLESLPAPVRIEPAPERVRFSMLFNGGVLLHDGRKITIGETFTFEGETEALAVACAICGIIGFESGRRIRF